MKVVFGRKSNIVDKRVKYPIFGTFLNKCKKPTKNEPRGFFVKTRIKAC